MATRYWVGGTGTWDASSTTHWSTASGGAGGASVPTSTDVVRFDSNSGSGTVTIVPVIGFLSCQELFTSGSIVLTSESGSLLYIYGGISLGSNTTTLLRVSMAGAAYTPSINTTNNILARVEINGSYNLSSDLLIDSSVGFFRMTTMSSLHTYGHNIGSSSNYISYVSLENSSSIYDTTNLYCKQLTVTDTSIASNVTCYIQPVNIGSFASLDIYNNSGGSTTFGHVYIDVSPTGQASISLAGSSVSFGSLEFGYNGSALNSKLLKIISNGTPSLSFTTLNMNGSATNRSALCVQSDQDFVTYDQGCINYGKSAPTITIMGSPNNIDYCDFKNVKFNSAQSPISAGNGGGNNNITFTPAVTRYAIPGGSRVWNSTASWSATSGGSGGASIPLAQDTVVFDSNSGSNGLWTAYVPAAFFLPTINASAFTSDALNLITSNAFFANNSLTGSTQKINLSASNLISSAGSSATFTNVIFSGNFAINENASITLSNSEMQYSYIQYGTLTNANQLTCRKVSGSQVSTSAPVTFNMGSDIVFSLPYGIDFSGSPSATFSGSPNLTYEENFTLYPIETQIKGVPARSWGVVNFKNAYKFIVYNSQTFQSIIYSINLTPLSTGCAILFEQGKTYTIGNWNVYGSSTESIVLTSHSGGVQSNSPHYLSYGGTSKASSGYLNISYSHASPSNKWYAGSTSTDGGNNTGWIFTNAPKGTNGFFWSNF